MSPVTSSLRARLLALSSTRQSSPLEQHFHEDIVPQLESLISAVESPDAVQVQQASRLWKPLRQICQTCTKYIRQGCVFWDCHEEVEGDIDC